METKFLHTYSRSNRKHWEKLLINYPNAFNIVHPYGTVHGTIGYCLDYDLHQIRTFNSKQKSFMDLKVVGKYHKVQQFDIKNLPITTHHRIKQKLYGDVYYLSKNGNKRWIVPQAGVSKLDRVSKLSSDLNIKYLIDKHCKNNTSIELIFSNDEWYLTNICTPEKIVDWKDVEKIGEYFSIKTPKLLSSKLLQYDSSLMDYFYSDYHFDDTDYIPTKEYIVMFEFRSRKYLFVKI